MSKKEFKDQNTGTEPTAPGRGEEAEARKNAAYLRQCRADMRQRATGLRQSTAFLREDIADEREDIADEREMTEDLRQEAATSKAKLGTTTQELLKEANERLIIASISAQKMAEFAERAKEQMSHMAGHDHLTGLPNRSLLQDRMAQSIDRKSVV